MLWGVISGTEDMESTIPNHEIKKALHIWMENQSQGNFFHIILSSVNKNKYIGI